MRRNQIRNITASLLQEVYKDVRVENDWKIIKYRYTRRMFRLEKISGF